MVVVLVDVTRSAEDTGARYLEDFRRVLQGIDGGTQLYVLPISAQSLVEAVRVEKHFPVYHALTTNPFLYKRQRRQLEQAAVAEFKGLLAETGGVARPGSHILDSLAQAAGILESYPKAPVRTVVVLSDMIEQSDIADFTALDDEAMSQVLQAADRRVGNIKADVLVSGVGDGAGDYHISAEKVLLIQSFWQEFFRRHEGAVKAYGSKLLVFPPRT